MSPRARGLRPGLYAVARYAGCRRSHNVTQGSRTPPWAICCRPRTRAVSPLRQCNQGSRTPPWAICCRPLRGLPALTQCHPGLADLPWAICCRPRTRACRRSRNVTQGSRTRPGLYAAARYAGCRRSLHCGCAPISFDRAKASSPTTTPSAPCLVARPMLHSHPSLTAWSLFF